MSDIVPRKINFLSAADYIDPCGLPFCAKTHYKQIHENWWHYHDFDELVIVLNGSGEHALLDHSYAIADGDVFLIKRDMVHCYQNTHNLVLANLLFDHRKVLQNSLDLADIPGYYAFFEAEPELRVESSFKAKHTLDPEQIKEVLLLLSKLSMEIGEKRPGWRYCAHNLLRELIVFIARSYNSDERKLSRRMIILSKMMRFVENNFRRNITRGDIIAAGATSISVGSRIFQEFLHLSPIGYLTQVRIRHAVELLQKEDMPVSEVAAACGIGDSNYFSTAFRKHFGMPPREFRKRTLQKTQKQ